MRAESCTECASTVCIKPDTLPGQASPQHSAPTAAIAGGVVGGVAAIAFITFLVWWFRIRKRRKEWDDQVWTEAKMENRDQTELYSDVRQSNVGSITSTVLTRASNVIQIAYIPGITNRSPPESPGLSAPPIPPIPIATANSSAASTPNFEQDRHFFMPRDLRDSTFSGFSEDDRHSITPSLARQSVASTIYRSNAFVDPMPATQALRGRAAVVSVKSASNTSAAPSSPLVQSSAVLPLAQTPANSNSTVVARNVLARPIEVKKSSSAGKVPTLASLKAVAESSARRENSQYSASKTTEPSIPEEEYSENDYSEKEVVPPRPFHIASLATPVDRSPVPVVTRPDSIKSTLTGISSAVGSSSPATNSVRGEPQEGPVHRQTRSGNGALNTLIEDAMNRAAREPTHGGLGSLGDHGKSDGGPFSDANEVKENL